MDADDKVNILLVDDQPGKLLAYETILNELGENLVAATSAREALELLLKSDFAVILVDVCMPGQNGFELVETIRQHHRYSQTAIIFVSAIQLTDLDHIRGYSSGAVDYVPVPVVPEILRAKVAVFVDSYRKARQLAKLNAELEQRVLERTAELQRTETVLLERDRMKDLFLATLAHELRNPLAPISSALELLQRFEFQDEQFALATQILDRQVSHLTRLVDDLVDLARIQGNRLELRVTFVDLESVLAVAIEASRPGIDRARQELVLDLPEEPMTIEADGVRISQIISNLLNNASKFAPEEGAIELLVRRYGNELFVSVRDNGIGIAASELTSVFEPFYQADTGESKPKSGLGIGLTLVRSIAEKHGGTVEVRSDGLSTGAEVIVRIPCVCETYRLPAATSSPDSCDASTIIRRKVLVADDNRDAAEMLSILIKQLGYEVEVAHDGYQAAQLARTSRPDILILDLGMPVADGFEVAREVRGFPWGQDVVIIALTGWGQPDVRQKTAEYGFDFHLVKPVPLEKLQEVFQLAQDKFSATPAN